MRLVRLTMLILLMHICILANTPVVTGQTDPRGLIELALDEPAHVTLENIKLGDAIEKLSERTGIRIFVPPPVMELAPRLPRRPDGFWKPAGSPLTGI